MAFDKRFDVSSKEEAVLLATRNAMRVLPLVGQSLRRKSKGWTVEKAINSLIFCSFRAIAASFNFSIAPNKTVAYIGHKAGGVCKYALENSGISSNKTTYGLSALAAALSMDSITSKYASKYKVALDFVEIENSNYLSARAASIFADGGGDIWYALGRDLTSLDNKISPRLVAECPIWYGDLPLWAKEEWQQLKHRLLDRVGENWQVWTDWYDARLAGRPIDLALETERVLSVTDEDWDKGPAHVNALIAAIEQRHKPLPEADPKARDFARPSGKPIRLVKEPVANGLADTPEQREWYAEVRLKFKNLAKCSPNQQGSIADDVAFFGKALKPRFDQTRWIALWSAGNTLRNRLDSHNAAPKGEMDPARLDEDVASRLRDLIETYNNFSLGDSNLAERDATRLGPRETEVHTNANSLVRPFIVNIVGNNNVVAGDAADVLNQSLDAATHAAKTLNGNHAIEQTAKTQRNFIIRFVSWVRDEIKYATRKVSDESYVELGKAVADKMKERAPDLVSAVAEHSSALIDYAHTYLNSPTVARIIEFVAQLFS